MRIQLWSYNYEPEPTGIGPVSTGWARQMITLGHEVDVVAAHPHYPEARWGSRRMPYRENRDGVHVLRLPLMIGRRSTTARMRQEASFAAAQSLALPVLPSADVMVAVSPCFPALAPAMVHSRLRGVPWALWLQDILPDGAQATGMLDEGAALRAARRLEAAAYRSAGRVFVISENFAANLRSKGVPEHKLVLVTNPATRSPRLERAPSSPPVLLSMGNIGHSQGLEGIVETFEADASLEARGARLHIAGHGVAADAVRSLITTDRVAMLGLLDDEALEVELSRAALGVVTQRPAIDEFNLPSKLMNFMAYGIPVVVAATPGSELERLINTSGAGWVADGADPGAFAAIASAALGAPEELAERGWAGRRYAERHFTVQASVRTFESTLSELVWEVSP